MTFRKATAGPQGFAFPRPSGSPGLQIFSEIRKNKERNPKWHLLTVKFVTALTLVTGCPYPAGLESFSKIKLISGGDVGHGDGDISLDTPAVRTAGDADASLSAAGRLTWVPACRSPHSGLPLHWQRAVPLTSLFPVDVFVSTQPTSIPIFGPLHLLRPLPASLCVQIFPQAQISPL